ncbi:HP0495 family protein [Endozoicomonas numazuensis]|uniref:UPF0250 protein GZ78_04680 n=1 Tax=Endozoicomonas numazuensis TaxID=1137799 RepID=A0A081NLF9_9GAMM|nr:DUF493 domain-containing protein [Endozoicomonas numazuensis]KEQ19282.1 hypothetical protein GZ78_04680 [Endozoicomonas numazuensis]
MTDQEAPKIEFPCDYEIRIVGNAAPDFQEVVCAIVKQHAPEYDGNFRLKESRTGKYTSVMVTIIATGEPQLKAIFEALKATGRVQMVL